MTDHFKTLGLEPGAKRVEIEAAFEEQLAARKARRRRTSDLHAAFAVLSDPTLRRAYELARFGEAASIRVADAKAVTIGRAREVVAQVDVQEIVHDARRLGLKSLVFVSRCTARVADVTADVSRSIQVAASRALENE
ncbi:MAG: hypothetical protein HGB10_01350 [Coriobacteriia bacterium]|nr:hypothetical protein [Coriobacteriia bacterium]